MREKFELTSFRVQGEKAERADLDFRYDSEKVRRLTPEEWVRQHFIHFLIESKGYPAQLIAVEKEIQVCGMKRRFDLVCYDRQANPYLIVECKAPSVVLSQAVFDQAFQYNLSIAARFIAITNGCLHFCGEISGDGKFQMLAEIPNFCG